MSARVYAIDTQYNPEFFEIVEGTISIFHCLARILIDSGSTHSFVTPNFMYGIDLKSEKLSHYLEVTTPTGEHCLLIDTIYRNCELCIEKTKF